MPRVPSTPSQVVTQPEPHPGRNGHQLTFRPLTSTGRSSTPLSPVGGSPSRGNVECGEPSPPGGCGHRLADRDDCAGEIGQTDGVGACWQRNAEVAVGVAGVLSDRLFGVAAGDSQPARRSGAISGQDLRTRAIGQPPSTGSPGTFALACGTVDAYRDGRRICGPGRQPVLDGQRHAQFVWGRQASSRIIPSHPGRQPVTNHGRPRHT